jgi:multidrug efflux system outer membrane protein
MKRLRLLAALAVLGCAAGCMVGPDYERPAANLPGGFALEEKPEDPRIAADWWRLFQDPLLDELVASARANNADLRFAAARVLEAEGVLREAGAAFFPEVTGAYSYGRNGVSSATSPANIPPLTRSSHQLLFSTSYEVDFWGRLARLQESARAGLLSTRYGRDVVELSLVGATAQGYFALRSLDVQIISLDQTIKTRSDALELARARLQSGLAAELDVYQAQSALSDALVQRRDTDRQRALVERELGQLTGRLDLKLPPGDVFRLPVPPIPPAGLPSALIERRPDIRGAEESLASANALIGAARAAMFPTISLTAGLGAQSTDFSDLLTSGAKMWTLGYGLALPIFDAGRRSARVDQAQARELQALASYQKAIETGFREVSEGLINTGQSAATETDLAERLQAARNALALSNARYEAGYSPFLEVLDAQRTANDAEIAFVRNRQARLAFSVDLLKALGGGWTDPSPRASKD